MNTYNCTHCKEFSNVHWELLPVLQPPWVQQVSLSLVIVAHTWDYLCKLFSSSQPAVAELVDQKPTEGKIHPPLQIISERCLSKPLWNSSVISMSSLFEFPSCASQTQELFLSTSRNFCSTWVCPERHQNHRSYFFVMRSKTKAGWLMFKVEA